MEENVNGQIVADEVQTKESEIVEAQNKVTEEVKEPKSCEGCVILGENEDFEKGVFVGPLKSRSYPAECGDCVIIKRNKRYHENQMARNSENSISKIGWMLVGLLVIISLMFLGYVFIVRPQQQKQDLSYEAEKAYLTLLDDERNRHLEYVLLGTINSSNNELYYLYEKDNDYYVVKDSKISLEKDPQISLEIQYQNMLYNLTDEEFKNNYRDNSVDGHGYNHHSNSKISDNYIDYMKLTPCDHYEERYNDYTYYNYCIFSGGTREYFNI